MHHDLRIRQLSATKTNVRANTRVSRTSRNTAIIITLERIILPYAFPAHAGKAYSYHDTDFITSQYGVGRDSVEIGFRKKTAPSIPNRYSFFLLG